MSNGNLKMKKRMKIELILFFVGFTVVLVKLWFIQFIKGGEYTAKALEQLNISRKIPAGRGIIYDCTGNILANSCTVYTVTINPAKISEENKEKVAKALSDIFTLEYEKIFENVNKNVSIVNIAKKQEKEKTDILRSWMTENNIFERNKY